MQRIINGKRYDTKTARNIAHDNEHQGRARDLFQTKKGNFFIFHGTNWVGECNTFEPISRERAKKMYEELEVWAVEYEVAFGEVPEEA